MGWLSELNAVYDQVLENNDILDKPIPLYHIKNNAPLEITLNGNGEFVNSRLLGKSEKKDWPTCMPCTEKSSARTSGVEAYPFCDKLEYVAGDYAEYAKGVKLEQKHNEYLTLLEAWADSEYSSQKIKTVYEYVRKGTLVHDILKCKLIPEMDTPEKIAASESNVFIRWNVEILGENSKTWQDEEIQQSWIDFYSKNCPNINGFCYVSEKIAPIAELHPAKIRHSGDSAKLISSNDNSNFTYRGRFTEANQACQISMEVSVKAHNALRWLIERQGAKIGNDLTVVAWCTAPKVQPQLLKRSRDLWENDDEEGSDNPGHYFTLEETTRKIKNRLRGYYGDITGSEKIFIMALNAATPGRMSILLYREFVESDFYNAQEFWHTHIAWFNTYWAENEKKLRCTVSSASPEDIADAAYGKRANDKIKIMTVQRLLSCIIDNDPIPADIEKLCFSRATRLYSLDNSERIRTLETACAVIKYNFYKGIKEDYNVGLEEDRKNRDYLYGRLLAVADRVESKALYLRNESRDTNAVRLMQIFARSPCSTWNHLYTDKLYPYFKQLGRKGDWYKSLIQEITSLFNHDEFVSNQKLTGEFLLGYHCQQKAFWDGIAKAKLTNSEQPEPNNTEGAN